MLKSIPKWPTSFKGMNHAHRPGGTGSEDWFALRRRLRSCPDIFSLRERERPAVAF
jgi:hypothetical protein